MAKRGSSSGRGLSQRQLKVGEAVRRALSDVLMRGDVSDPALAQFSITVSEVRTSPDLRHATAFVLPLGGRRADEALAALKLNAREIRHLVTRSVNLKYSPELHFVIDESFDRMEATEKLLSDERVTQDTRRQDDDNDC